MSTGDEDPQTYDLVEPDPLPRRTNDDGEPRPLFGERNRYCRDCGYNLRGVRTPQCPECGRQFNPLDFSSFHSSPPEDQPPVPTRQIVRDVLLIAALYAPAFLAVHVWWPGLWCAMFFTFPLWLSAIVYVGLRLVPEGRIDSLLAHVTVGAAIGALVPLSLTPWLFGAVFWIIAAMIIGAITGLIRRHQSVV